ncbi:poly(A) RNA polymerase gld-2 homolog A-like isoform X2 [Agrilus planipennis]|uniref:Poly(A) RNA polymerase gld-2 homolog A-like isoform X2 n=1 Tax=Agrilus planipennis TaxID=224129 RepID=A0A1W4WGU6_AGRPL|nr:poly(A) RNA polymerase gld-2 homolog A-like isoform X2 [Agrilus planipennis]
MMANEFPVHLHFSQTNMGNQLNFGVLQTENFGDVDRSGIRNNSRMMLKEQNIHVKDTNYNVNNFRFPINLSYMECRNDLENRSVNEMDNYNLQIDGSTDNKMLPHFQLSTLNNRVNGVRNCKQKLKENFRSKTSQGYESDESCASQASDKNGKSKILRDNCRLQKAFIYNRCNSPNFYLHPFTPQQPNSNYNRTRCYSNSITRPVRNKKHSSSDDMVRRVHGLMERFTSRANTLLLNPIMGFHKSGSPWDELDQSIWETYHTRVQKKEKYIQKLQLWSKLYLHIGNLLDRFGLFMVGSTMSGLATDNSDIDMCLLVRTFSNDPRSDSVRYLDLIRSYLLQCDFVTSPEVIHAKVPILKFMDSEKRFEIDLNCNNSVGIRNTHLLHCYAHLDWRVQPLVIIVKLWAQVNHINDAKNMTISSYSLALMVIHYLQCGVTPPVIPCLHGLYPDKFSPDIEIHNIDVQEELPPFFSDNKQSLGELLVGFLHYYTFFDYDSYAISVRLGSYVPIDECRYARAPKNDPHQWKCLCIEEPFDLTNTARSVYDLETFKRIKRVFHSSYAKVIQTKRLESVVVENQR